jgi:hypothetical protein
MVALSAFMGLSVLCGGSGNEGAGSDGGGALVDG